MLAHQAFYIVFIKTKWLQEFALKAQEVLNQKQHSEGSQQSTEMLVRMLQF